MTLTDRTETASEVAWPTNRLTDTMLGCNPDPAPGTGGWSGRTGRVFDVLGERYGPGDWSISCHDGVIHNSPRVVGPGTIGWIHRSDGGWGHLAGLIGFTAHPRLEADGEVYCDGIQFPLPSDWWISGEDINAAGWGNRAPWGSTTPRRFQNGQEMTMHDVTVLEALLHPVVRQWVHTHRGFWTP